MESAQLCLWVTGRGRRLAAESEREDMRVKKQWHSGHGGQIGEDPVQWSARNSALLTAS
jgi:hypothetical protein